MSIGPEALQIETRQLVIGEPCIGYSQAAIMAIGIDHAHDPRGLVEIDVALSDVRMDMTLGERGAESMAQARERRRAHLFGVHIVAEDRDLPVGPGPHGLLLVDAFESTARGKVLDALVAVWRVPDENTKIVSGKRFAQSVIRHMLGADRPLFSDMPQFSDSATIRIPLTRSRGYPESWGTEGIREGGVTSLRYVKELVA